MVTFDVQLGGEITFAVVSSDDQSVSFDRGNGFSQSGTAVGNIVNDDFRWTVYFMNAAGDVVDYMDFSSDELMTADLAE